MKTLFIPLLILSFRGVYGQQKTTVHNYSVIKITEWVIPLTDTLDYALDQYLEQKALIMKRKIDNYKSASVAYPKNLKFKDGIIEMDAAWPGAKNGFIGLAFRIKDEHHY